MRNINLVEFERSVKTQTKCFRCGSTCDFLNRVCMFHTLCSECEIESFLYKFTVCCLDDLSKEDREIVKPCLNVCTNCSMRRENDIISICKCKLCLACTNTIFTERNCVNCNSLRISDFIRCFVCNSVVANEFSAKHHCGESTCFECIRKRPATMNSGNEILIAQCHRCSEMFEDKVMNSVLGEEEWKRIFNEYLKTTFGLVSCPNCNEFYSLEENEVVIRLCLNRNCNSYFCGDCGKILNNCECEHDFCEIFHRLSIDERGKVVCCGCKRPYLKKGDRILCKNIRCRIEFCANCGALWSSVENHGPHYHQRGCRFYKRSVRTDYFNPKCESCRIIQGLCSPGQFEQRLELTPK